MPRIPEYLRVFGNRRLLLGVFAVLLVLGLLHAVSYDNKEVFGVAFSRDGRELFVFRGDHEYTSAGWQLDEASCEVEVWDVQTGRLLRKKHTGDGLVTTTEDREHLLEFSRDRKVRLINRYSFETLKSWQIPDRISNIVRVEGTDRLLVVFWNNPSAAVACFEVKNDQLREVWSELGSALIANNGRRLITSKLDPKTSTSTFLIFDVSDSGVTTSTTTSHTFPAIAYAGQAANSADVVMLSGQGGFPTMDLGNGSAHFWTATKPLSVLRLSPDGKKLHAIYWTGTWEVIELSSGEIIHAHPSNAIRRLKDIHVSPDNRLIAGTFDNRHVQLLQIADGKILRQWPADHRLIRWLLLSGYIIWCAAWIYNGSQRRLKRPWLDVLLIHLPLVVLIVHASSRPVHAIHPLVLAVSIAILASMLALLIVWCGHGHQRWSLRLPGLLAGLASLAALLVLPGRGAFGVWNVMLGSISFMVGLSFLVASWQWGRARYSISNIRDLLPADTSAARVWWQLPLKDLLLITGSLALLFAVMRFAEPGRRQTTTILWYVTLQGLLLALTLSVCAVAALVVRRQRLWILFALLVLLVSGAAPSRVFGTSSPDPLWWCEVLYGTAGLLVFCSLLVFRLQGYRLTRQIQSPPITQA